VESFEERTGTPDVSGNSWIWNYARLLHAFDQHPDIINNDGAAVAINVRDPYSCGRRAERGTQ